MDGLRFGRVAEGFGLAVFFLIDAVLDGLVIEEEGLAEEGIEAGIALAGGVVHWGGPFGLGLSLGLG